MPEFGQRLAEHIEDDNGNHIFVDPEGLGTAWIKADRVLELEELV